MLSIDFKDGGGEVLDRIIQAYGFESKIEYCKHLDITASNLSMRYKRNLFPSDLVVRCLADTNVRLAWLVTGAGDMFDGDNARNQTQQQTLVMPVKKLIDGELYESDSIFLDKGFFLPDRPLPEKPGIILDGHQRYIVDHHFKEIKDSRWLVKIEGTILVRDLIRIPVNRVKVKGGELPFDCDLSDIEVLALVVMTCN